MSEQRKTVFTVQERDALLDDVRAQIERNRAIGFTGGLFDRVAEYLTAQKEAGPHPSYDVPTLPDDSTTEPKCLNASGQCYVCSVVPASVYAFGTLAFSGEPAPLCWSCIQRVRKITR